jgi:cation:H+ antiporter
MAGLSTLILVAIFAGAGAITWIAGIYLSKTTDALDVRLGLGEALGGMILLSIAGSLPELAITVSAALTHNLGMAAGNLIGGIAIQTVVLVIADFYVKGDRPLSYLVGKLIPVLEALLVVLVTAVVMMGAALPSSVNVAGVSPASVFIVVVWVAGIAVINRVRKGERWEAVAPGAAPGRKHRRIRHAVVPHPYEGRSTALVVGIFGLGSLATLAAGAVLQLSGSALADRFGVNGVVFGATILALVSALPEISTGLAAIELGDHQLVMGDIFGGNAFQVCLFLLADLIAGSPALPASGAQNGWLAAGGIVLTGVYAGAIIFRPQRRYLRLGIDSILVLLLYVLIVLGVMQIH